MNYQLLRFAPVAMAAALALTACNRQETLPPRQRLSHLPCTR